MISFTGVVAGDLEELNILNISQGNPIPATSPHLDFLGVEEVGVLGAVHQNLGPVPILGAPRTVPSGRLMAALPLQRGALAARVAHGGGLGGHGEAGPGLTSGKVRGSRNQGVTGTLRKVGATGTALLGLGFRAGIRLEPA